MSEAERPRKRLGRPPGPNPSVRHRERPAHDPEVPLAILLLGRPGLPSFRRKDVYPAFEDAVRRTRRDGFRIVEYATRDDRVHLIVEADSLEALHHGMKSFSVRANRLFNSATGRERGPVWGDRYLRRDLRTAQEVRDALVACLATGERLDLASSARWFAGWNRKLGNVDDEARPTERARSRLLTMLWWKQLGLIDPSEVPSP